MRLYPVNCKLFSHYQCLYSGYRLGLWIVACSGCGGPTLEDGGGTGALAMLGGSSLVELLGDGKYSRGTATPPTPLTLALVTCPIVSSLAHRAICC